MTDGLMFDRRQLYNLVWPLLTEQLLNVLVGVIDVIMVAVLGEAAVSGVSLVDSINTLVINVLAALTSGGTVVCAQYIGKKDIEKSGEAAGQLIILALLLTTAIALTLLFGGKQILAVMFGQVEASVMDNAYIYCLITACSIPFLGLYNSCASIFRATGNSKLPMQLSFLMNVGNIIGNAIGIFVLDMGVAGVAAATLLARAVASLVIFRELKNSGSIIKVRGETLTKINRDMIYRILSIGVPASFESGMFNFGKLILQSLVSTLGTAAIAGYAVACNLVTFLYLPGNALGIGKTTVVSQCIGAGKFEQAKYYSDLFIKLNYAVLFFICLPLGLFRHYWVGLYNLQDKAAEIAAFMLLTHVVAMILWPPAFLRPYFFRACNLAQFTMKTSLLIMGIFRIGFAYLFVKGMNMGVEAVWYAMFIDWVVRLVIFQYKFTSLKKLESAVV